MTKVDAARFSQIMRNMARISSRASAEVARKINEEMRRNFDKGVDPYGRKWKRLAKSTIEKGRHPPPLTDTGAGRASIMVQPARGSGIRITVGLLYMIYHQFGGPSHLRGKGRNAVERYKNRKKHRDFGRDKDRGGTRGQPPKRSFLPFDKMPSAWLAIWQKAIDQAARRALRGVTRG